MNEFKHLANKQRLHDNESLKKDKTSDCLVKKKSIKMSHDS